MKYLQLFENWNPLSKEDFAEARALHKIGVVSAQELALGILMIQLFMK